MTTKWLGTPTDCGFCNKPIPPETPYKYVYPIPKPHASHNFEGAKCCLDCWPTVHAAQVEQGLVQDTVPGTGAHVHAST